jgi:hypothetical protein
VCRVLLRVVVDMHDIQVSLRVAFVLSDLESYHC